MATSKKVGGKVIYLIETVQEQMEKPKTSPRTNFRTASLLKSCNSKWLQVTFTNLFFVILCKFVFVVT